MTIKGTLLSGVPIVSDFQSKILSPFFRQKSTFGSPKMGYMSPLIFVTPKRHILACKRHILAWFRVFWVIMRQNRSKGLTCGLFPEKRYMYVCKNNLTLYFTHLPRSPPRKDLHLNWYSGSSRGHNQLWQFFGNQLRGLDSVGGQSLPFPIDLAGRR